MPLEPREVEAEPVSPTGAALLSTLVEAYGPIPRMVVETVGYGAGPRRVPSPNALRVLIGEGRAAATPARDLSQEAPTC